MGNTSTKESRPSQSTSQSRSHNARHASSSTSAGPSGSSSAPIYNQHRRGSRPDLSFLGLGGGSDRDTAELEARRETKQEREARRAAKEKAAREKERERSMREESVDGGFLVTQGVYTGTEDFNKSVVRQLMVERRIAPFWKGLNDHSESWTEHQLVAAVRGLPIPAADEIPPDDSPHKTASSDPQTSEPHSNTLGVPINSPSQAHKSGNLQNQTASQPASSLPSVVPPSNSPLFRGRAKTLASLTTSKNNSSADMAPREIQIPKDPNVNGQPIEAYLYKDAIECPICFLYYPPFLNKTRCCDQPICSECFVQIKRPDPHPPEHSEPQSPAAVANQNSETPSPDEEGGLVSEPASCPFCVQPEFGITFEPPPFRRGLMFANMPSTNSGSNATSAMSSASSISPSAGTGSLLPPSTTGRRRTTSLSANAPTVITTDKIRPDWAQKLSNARAHAARRSAAATALHTAAYLMGNNSTSDARGLSNFGRRGGLRRRTGPDEGPSNGSGGQRPGEGAGASSLGFLLAAGESRGSSGRVEASGEGQPSMLAPPDRVSSRGRSRMEDLEDMMMMEAIRLSLASEEERKKKEDKDAKKEAKKREKENKKAEKAAKKKGLYPGGADDSASGFESIASGAVASVGSGASSISGDVLGDVPAVEGKGKSVDRPANATQESTSTGLSSTPSPARSRATSSVDPTSTPQQHLEQSRAPLHLDEALQPSHPSKLEAQKPSHLRQISNTSSSASSFVESGPASLRNEITGSNSSFEPSPSASGVNVLKSGSSQEFVRSPTPSGGAGTEPMFNFRSLAAMIGDEEKAEMSHVEDSGPAQSSDQGDNSGGRANETSQGPDFQGQNQHTTLARSMETIRAVPPSPYGEEDSDETPEDPFADPPSHDYGWPNTQDNKRPDQVNIMDASSHSHYNGQAP
ncbi:MAG: hypothetical protein M1819_003790 [Sarea resinae]|nr:MAG: hypothetical protein M1819_003790 [Sarea resinae]